MAQPKGAYSSTGLTLDQKDAYAKKAIALGKGGQKKMAEKAGVSGPTMSQWCADYRSRNPEGTMVSAGPKSAVASKPNGAAAPIPQLPPFLQGLEEVIHQIVDARVEEAVKRVLRTTSLMELMKQ